MIAMICLVETIKVHLINKTIFSPTYSKPDQPDQPIIETNEELETVHKSTDVELPQEIPLEQEQIPQQPQQQENVIDDLFGTSNNDDDFLVITIKTV